MPESSPDPELEALLERLRQQPEAAGHRQAGERLVRAGRYVEALRHYEEAVRLDPMPVMPWYGLGAAAHLAGERETVRAALAAFEQRGPEGAWGLALRANLLRMAGDAPAAEALALRALDLETVPSRRAWTQRVLAGCRRAQGDVDGAMKRLRLAVAEDPDNVEALETLVERYRERGEYRAALPLLEKLTALDPEHPSYRYALGAARRLTGDPWQARELLDMAIAMGHDTARSHGELGLALAETGDSAEAVAELERALTLAEDPVLRAALLDRLARVHHDTGQRDESHRCYAAAVGANPESAAAHQNLGAAYAERGELDSAILHLREAARLAPEDRDVWYALGFVLSQAEELAPAAEALERAIALGYPDGRARAQLAWVCQRQGRARDAAEHARRALRQSVPRKWRAWVAGIADSSRRSRR